MNPLQSRKRLLLAESELNRLQLAGDMAALKADVRALTSRARSIAVIASAAAVLVAGLSAFRHATKRAPATQPSCLQTILKGAGLI